MEDMVSVGVASILTLFFGALGRCRASSGFWKGLLVSKHRTDRRRCKACLSIFGFWKRLPTARHAVRPDRLGRTLVWCERATLRPWKIGHSTNHSLVRCCEIAGPIKNRRWIRLTAGWQRCVTRQMP